MATLPVFIDDKYYLGISMFEKVETGLEDFRVCLQ